MRHIIACIAACMLVALSAQAQTYPSKPIRLVVGFPAGGPADIFGRAIALKLTEVTGQQVVVDNRAGAGGILAAENVAKRPRMATPFISPAARCSRFTPTCTTSCRTI
jgi:tripartite-type tricarboxylate transporter receptor subunit TctC